MTQNACFFKNKSGLFSISTQGEEEKGEEVEEEEDDGWMVPHGYLSEGEGCSEDDEVC